MHKNAQKIEGKPVGQSVASRQDDLQGIEGDSESWPFGEVTIGNGSIVFCKLLDTWLTVFRAEGKAFATISFKIKALGWYTRKAFVNPPGGLGVKATFYVNGAPLDQVTFRLMDQWCNDDGRPEIDRVEIDPNTFSLIGGCSLEIDESKTWHKCGVFPG
ncbi:hypothetical protein GB927_016535 [Shinella sp. CPCC 100929]|uniref:Uncharacterized protein n=1 Tax=Shinella lacus TaxID=2654216 RepID=A0ABT1R902_9HYPH|nr:hypothetical protein [Shinella lacus]MCQ4631660.1 hypothetical protein [Shinella lacus]